MLERTRRATSRRRALYRPIARLNWRRAPGSAGRRPGRGRTPPARPAATRLSRSAATIASTSARHAAVSRVDQHIIIFGPVADFARRALHAAGDHFLAVGAASAQAPFEFGQRWRQDENPDEILAHRRMKLLRALPVDVEQDVAAGLQRGLHRRLGRAVAIVEHRRPFDELAGLDQPVELGIVDEMIVDIVALARPLGAGRRRDRHGHFGIGRKQHPADRRLARARRRGEHDQQAATAAREGG